MLYYKHNKAQATWPASFFNLSVIGFLLVTLFLMKSVATLVVYGDRDMSLSDNLKRITLIQQVLKQPDMMDALSPSDLSIVLSKPNLQKTEGESIAWAYHGESCALNVYFSDADAPQADYIEYAPLTLNAMVQEELANEADHALDMYCLKDILNTQGINTPDSYARQPTPSWDNPYRL